MQVRTNKGLLKARFFAEKQEKIIRFETCFNHHTEDEQSSRDREKQGV